MEGYELCLDFTRRAHGTGWIQSLPMCPMMIWQVRSIVNFPPPVELLPLNMVSCLPLVELLTPILMTGPWRFVRGQAALADCNARAINIPAKAGSLVCNYSMPVVYLLWNY